MAGSTEIKVSLPDLKTASIRLQKLADEINANWLAFTFSKSKGSVAEEMRFAISKYNELGAALGAMVAQTKRSVDATRESFKQADENLASHWMDNATGVKG